MKISISIETIYALIFISFTKASDVKVETGKKVSDIPRKLEIGAVCQHDYNCKSRTCRKDESNFKKCARSILKTNLRVTTDIENRNGGDFRLPNIRKHLPDDIKKYLPDDIRKHLPDDIRKELFHLVRDTKNGRSTFWTNQKDGYPCWMDSQCRNRNCRSFKCGGAYVENGEFC